MATHIRKQVMLPAPLDRQVRQLAKERGSSQSGLIAHLLAVGIAVENADGDPLMRYRQHRELSFLKLLRYLQAVAERWLQRLFSPPLRLRAFLQQLCLKADRLVTKASRKRRTSAQRLRESVQTQNNCIKLTIKLAA